MFDLNLSKFEIRTIENQIRSYKKEIKKLEKRLRDDKNTYLIARGKKKIDRRVAFDYARFSNLKNKEMGLEVELDILHYRVGNDTICLLIDDELNVVGLGYAECNEEDIYSRSIGMSIAECRALSDYYEYCVEEIIESL